MTILTMRRTDPKKAYDYFHAKNRFTTGPVELSHMIKEVGDQVNVVDVRSTEDFQKEHIPGSINIPREKWESGRGLSKDKNNVLICYSQQCHLAAKAAEQFSAEGYPVMEMEGGFKAWKDNGLETES